MDGDSAREPRCGDELLFIGTVGLKAKHRQAIMSRLGYEDGGVLRRCWREVGRLDASRRVSNDASRAEHLTTVRYCRGEKDVLFVYLEHEGDDDVFVARIDSCEMVAAVEIWRCSIIVLRFRCR